jgi:hypothetical protein
MEKELGIICAEGFSFFGNTNRLISHELKNILAIISETLGLADELMELNERGVKMEPGKLQSLNASVIEEVDRANLIIRNMNMLAHSVDKGISEVDINQMVALSIKISQLNPRVRDTEISLQETESCHVHSNPFFLATLFHHAINFALANAGPDRKISISIRPKAYGANVSIAGMVFKSESFPSMEVKALAKALSAVVSPDASLGELNFEIPEMLVESVMKDLFPAE